MAAGVEKRQLPALTGIRFFLALWVVVYHHSPSLIQAIGDSSSLQHALASIFRTGYAAVSLFFVLSGFVLTYNYDLSTLLVRRNATRFGIARFSRIYPAYLTGLLLLIPLAIYRVVAHVQNVDGYYGIGNFFLNLLLLQSWVPAAALTWNYPGWSLSNEAFFYAVLPVIGGYLSRLGGPFLTERRKQIALTLFVAAGALWMLSLIIPLSAVFQQLPSFGDAPATDMQPVDGFWANLIRYNPLLRLPEFCIGVILARLYRLVPGTAYVWNRGMVFYLPGFALALLLLVCGDSIPYPLMHNGLLVPACALIIFGLALDGGFIARVLAAPALVFLGNASYCMYILHAPISAWMKIGFVRVLHMRPEGITWFTCYVVACVTVSCVFFKTIEDPLHRTLKRRLNAWANGLAGLTSVQPVEK